MRFEQEDLHHPTPEGECFVEVIRVQETESRIGNPMVVIVMTLQEPPFQGQWLRDYFVIDGDSHQAAAIGRRRLAALCQLAGLTVEPDQEVDLQDLVGARLVADVERDIQGGRSLPSVKSYRRREGTRQPF